MMNKSYRLLPIFHLCPNNDHPDARTASDVIYNFLVVFR
jgi:hypothetical protein